MALSCYEEILKLRSALQVSHYPNVCAIACNLSGGSPLVEQQWISYALSCVQNGIPYFNSKFSNDSVAPLNAFKAARYFSPSKIKSMNPFAPDIDCMSAIPFLNDPAILTSLKGELPLYIARADSVDRIVSMFLNGGKIIKKIYLSGLLQQVMSSYCNHLRRQLSEFFLYLVHHLKVSTKLFGRLYRNINNAPIQ